MLRSTITILTIILLLALPGSASAASYWVSLSAARGEIAPGVNGFTTISHGGPFSAYGSTCEGQAGSYVAGAYCRLRFTVPAGLTAGAVGNGGIARGDFRTSNAYFVLRSERPGGNPSGVTDSDGDGAFNHGWGALGAYVDLGLRVNSATTVTGMTNWFHINTFDVVLHDPTSPTIQHVQAGNGGWNGPGCLPHSYSWADTGSQVSGIAITNLSTGAQVDSWSVATTGVVSGHPIATDTGCTPAPGTGTFAYRTTAYDRSGNSAIHDYTLAFDTTLPTVEAPMLDGAQLADGTVIDSRHGYRPAVTWSGVGDAHSGISSVITTLDGSPLAHVRTGGTVVLAPAANIPMGSHELRIAVTDVVGNRTTIARTIDVRDDVVPAIAVASPGGAGGAEPVLDISATDDFAGLDPATWTVRVNGATLVASSAGHRLQANIGRLVDGTHSIDVSVADRAGNIAERRVTYRADSGDDVPDPPSLDGIFVFDAPTVVESGSTHHVRALVVKAGRPVEGTVELRLGPLVLDTDEIAPNGSVDLSARIAVAGPLHLYAPSGSGLATATIEYELRQPSPVPLPTPPEPAGSTTTNNTTTTINNPPSPAATGGASQPAGSGLTGTGYPRNVVYYVGNVPYWNGLPLAESGATLDRVAPSWRMSLIQHRAGTVRRSRRIAFRLWTSEMAVMSFSPTGSERRTTISPRRQQRTVFIAIARGSRLDATVRRARKGAMVTVRIKVVATDKNENRSFPRTVSFRVRA